MMTFMIIKKLVQIYGARFLPGKARCFDLLRCILASRPCEPVRRLHSCSVSALDTVFAAVAKILFTDFLTELLPSRSVLADDFSAPASSGASDLLRSSAACTLPILSL
jgi:hypothetical protein